MELVQHAESDAWLSLGLSFYLNVLPLTRLLSELSGSMWSKALQVSPPPHTHSHTPLPFFPHSQQTFLSPPCFSAPLHTSSPSRPPNETISSFPEQQHIRDDRLFATVTSEQPVILPVPIFSHRRTNSFITVY